MITDSERRNFLHIVSILVAAAINALKFDRKVVRFFERSGIWSIVGALLLGIVSPF